MHKKPIAIVLIFAFLAHSVHSGLHLLEPGTAHHDCEQHGVGDLVPDSSENKEHLTCIFCQNTSGEFEFLYFLTDLIDDFPIALGVVEQRSPEFCFARLGVHFLRGPPIWV